MKNWLKQKLIDLQRYTKTDNIYLAKYGSIMFSSNIVSAGVALALSLAFAHFISKETYGHYRLLSSGLGLVSILTLPGLFTALQRAVAQGFGNTLGPVVAEKRRWGVLAAIALIAMGTYYHVARDLPTVGLIAFIIGALCIPLLESYKLYAAYLSGKKEFNVSSGYAIVGQLSYAVVMVGTMFLWPHLLPIAVVLTIGNTIIQGIIFHRTLKNFPPTGSIDVTAIPYVRKLVFSNFISAIANQIDAFISYTFIGPVALANYSFATLPSDKLDLITNPIIHLAFPKLAAAPREHIRANVYAVWLKLWLLGAIIVGAFIVAAPYFYQLLFPNYVNMVGLSQLYSLTFLTLPNGIILTTFEAKGMIKELYMIQIFASATQIALALVLGIQYGLLGLIVSRVINTGLKTIVFLLLARRI